MSDICKPRQYTGSADEVVEFIEKKKIPMNLIKSIQGTCQKVEQEPTFTMFYWEISL